MLLFAIGWSCYVLSPLADLVTFFCHNMVVARTLTPFAMSTAPFPRNWHQDMSSSSILPFSPVCLQNIGVIEHCATLLWHNYVNMAECRLQHVLIMVLNSAAAASPKSLWLRFRFRIVEWFCTNVNATRITHRCWAIKGIHVSMCTCTCSSECMFMLGDWNAPVKAVLKSLRLDKTSGFLWKTKETVNIRENETHKTTAATPVASLVLCVGHANSIELWYSLDRSSTCRLWFSFSILATTLAPCVLRLFSDKFCYRRQQT